MKQPELARLDDRCILTIYSTKTDNGEDAFYYDLPDKAKLFKLIGFMEAIKLELLDYANENPSNEEIEDEY